ncbi:vitamin K epoxide reductase family protein [Patescibacteria group bacterium]|nr:vitamin K epoxide reductase family protein [Patescibacteria group bacterium]
MSEAGEILDEKDFPRFERAMKRFIQPNIFLYFFLLILGISGFFFAVIWPHAVGFYAFITLAAVGGFGVSLYIYYTKRHHKQLVCPIGSNCNAVINSKYATFLGVSLEYWGMLYYAVIFAAYIVFIFASHLFSGLFLAGLIMLTAAAFFFSLYLLFAQAFLLRQWCIWCILSASLSIGIFVVSLASVDFATAFFAEMRTVIGAIHDLGFALGIGGATAVLFLFSRFLRDLDIDEKESQTLKEISELIWLGLALTLVSQFAFFVAFTETLARSGPFLAQTIALFVVAVGGAVLLIIIAPFLAAIPFNEKKKYHHHSSLESLRKPLFITGAVALSSWYFAFFMNYLPEYELTVLLSAYIAVLALAVIISLFWEKSISRGK